MSCDDEALSPFAERSLFAAKRLQGLVDFFDQFGWRPAVPRNCPRCLAQAGPPGQQGCPLLLIRQVPVFQDACRRPEPGKSF
jgi:hypothetical protein